jgi:WNK lysine deficient protein kinase
LAKSYQVKLRTFASAPTKLDRLFAEVDLLKSLHHPHILSLHKQWQSSDGMTFNFITEICPSGDLRGYRKKHKNVSLKALRKWAHQILLGLHYLHAQEPCVIHRDLKCSNIFVKGNIGQVRFLCDFWDKSDGSPGKFEISNVSLL